MVIQNLSCITLEACLFFICYYGWSWFKLCFLYCSMGRIFCFMLKFWYYKTYKWTNENVFVWNELKSATTFVFVTIILGNHPSYEQKTLLHTVKYWLLRLASFKLIHVTDQLWLLIQFYLYSLKSLYYFVRLFYQYLFTFVGNTPLPRWTGSDV